MIKLKVFLLYDTVDPIYWLAFTIGYRNRDEKYTPKIEAPIINVHSRLKMIPWEEAAIPIARSSLVNWSTGANNANVESEIDDFPFVTILLVNTTLLEPVKVKQIYAIEAYVKAMIGSFG